MQCTRWAQSAKVTDSINVSIATASTAAAAGSMGMCACSTLMLLLLHMSGAYRQRMPQDAHTDTEAGVVVCKVAGAIHRVNAPAQEVGAHSR